MTLPLVNIIIVTFNQYFYTASCVQSLLNCGYDNLKIILVDNGSDESKYQNFFNQHQGNSRLEFIRLDENLGFGGGCNLGLSRVNSGFVVFLNNDTEVAVGWLQPMVEYLESHPEVGAVQPKIKDIKNKDYFEYAGAAGGFMDVYGFPFSRGRIFYTLEKDAGQYDEVADLVWCSGTALMTRKEILDKVGVFDEIFFMYGEESDLCWRINHAGYRLVSVPQSVVYHQGAGTMGLEPTYKKVFYSHRNGLILLLKNYTVAEWWRYLTVRLGLDAVALVYYIVISPLAFSWLGVIGAYLHLVWLSPQIWRRHWQIRAERLNSPLVLPARLYRRSVIIDYFFRRRKKFSQLDPQNFI
ncbi:MAG: glycosyltransferase [Patescibacteria group bacterium]|jgi:hypothetical protein